MSNLFWEKATQIWSKQAVPWLIRGYTYLWNKAFPFATGKFEVHSQAKLKNILFCGDQNDSFVSQRLPSSFKFAWFDKSFLILLKFFGEMVYAHTVE